MMKISKGEGIIILAAASFLAFTAGWFLRGAGLSQPIRVETQRDPAEEVLVLPEPTAAPAGQKIDINQAGVDELMTLPGIGEKRAEDIVADREENGPFRFPEDLTRVKGIGEETVRAILELITVEGETA